jgi:hypothetical protein
MNSKLYTIATTAILAATVPASAQIFGDGGLIRGDVGRVIRGTVEEPIRRSNVTAPSVTEVKKPDPIGPCPGNPSVCMQRK